MPVTSLRGGVLAASPTVTALGTTTNGAGSTATITLTITANVAVGETIIAACGWNAVGAGEAVGWSDSVQGSWTTFIGLGDSDNRRSAAAIGVACAARNCTTALTSGSSTITATLPAARTEVTLGAFKVSESGLITPISKAWDGSGTTATGTSVTMAPGNNGPLWAPFFAVAAFNNHATSTGTTPTGYTSQISVADGSAGAYRLQVFWRYSATVQSFAPTSTITSGLWIAASFFYWMNASPERGRSGSASLTAATH